MAYNPATDFLGLWRNNAGQVSKLEMPGLDYVVAALARAGIITVSVSATAPVANQSTTAWLKAAVPSYSAEGQFFLWDKVTTTYLPATAALFLQLLEATAGESGISWWTTTGGPPSNAVGLNGDYAIRTDAPGGIYGPKAAGAWPANPLPGTTDTLTSTSLDNTFGTAEGAMIYRDALVWEALAVGTPNSILVSNGTIPAWETLSALMDAVFSNAEGAILYRDAALWQALPAGAAGQVLASGGFGAPPAWAPRTAEFPSGTVMIFQQTAAPTGWTKQTVLNDYGLRVTSGTVGTTPGSAFSTVFAQTAVGNTTIDTTQMPSHNHALTNLLGATVLTIAGGAESYGAGGNAHSSLISGLSVNNTGGGLSHTHSVNLSLAYTDVIIASKN